MLPAVAQAAIAHAQFETIHPFVDGNGRTGRALIHAILRRRDIAPRFVPPISLVLATFADAYVNELTRTRYDGDPDRPESIEAINAWIGFFAGACKRAVADAEELEARVAQLQEHGVHVLARCAGTRRSTCCWTRFPVHRSSPRRVAQR